MQHEILIPKEPSAKPEWLPCFILLCIPPVSFIGAFMLGKRLLREWKRYRFRSFRAYENAVGNEAYVTLDSLCRTLGKNRDTVIRDLNVIISAGFAGHGAYLDLAKGYLVLRPDEYRENVLASQKQKSAPRHAGAAPAQKAQTEKPRRTVTPQAVQFENKEKAQTPPAAQPAAPEMTTKEEFDAKILEIRRLNDEIADEQVSLRISRMEELTASIFRYAVNNPQREAEVRKFMNYYLPTTLKLLKSYSLLEKQSYQGENISYARHEIESILDTIIAGFEHQLDRLFRADALDISADIQVLETMMAKDGLTEKPGMTMKSASR